MCRNIRVLFNFDPPATEEEIQAAALQYVRKVSGAQSPSKANKARFEAAVLAITDITRELLSELTTTAPPHNREVFAQKAKERNAKRFQR